MPRLPYAAKQFIEEVRDVKPRAKAEPRDLDGLNVYRTLRFDKRTSKVLGPALLTLEMAQELDARIQEFGVSDAGYLYVTFVGTPDADLRDPFLIAEAVTVAEAEGRTQTSD